MTSNVAKLMVVSWALLSMQSVVAGPYWGASLGSTEYDVSEQVSHGMELTAGIYVAPNTALEMSYLNLGDIHTQSYYDLNVSGLTIAGKTFVPISDTLSVYGKLGWYLWSASEVYEYDEYEPIESGADLILGGGLSFMASDHMNVNFEYKEMDLNGAGSSNFSIGVEFSF